MLVGRDDEIRSVAALIKSHFPAPGMLHFIQLDGEIGAGKSALLLAVINELRAANLTGSPTPRIFLAQGDHVHMPTPLAAFRVLCEGLLGDPLERLLDRATPAVLATLCSEALDSSPLVIAVDDADKLDTASIRFLETLMQHPPRGPLTILVVHRFGHTPWNLVKAAHRRGALYDHHTVEALSDQAIANIAEDLPDHHVTAVVEASRGNPLFAHTAIAGFRDHPDARQISEVVGCTGNGRTAILTSTIADDLEPLTAPARKTLEALAVLDISDAESVAKVADLDCNDMQAGVQELAERGLATNNLHQALHPVVRFGVYQNTDIEQRSALHRRAANLPNTELFARAEHLTGVLRSDGLLTQQEIEVLIEAATLAIGSDPRTIHRWLGSLPPRFQTPKSEMLLARAMMLTGDFEGAIHYLRALTQTENSPEVQILLVDALRITGHIDEARALLASAHQWANGAEPALLREYIDVLALIDGHAPDELVSRLESLPDTSGRDVNRTVAAIYRTMTLLSEGRVPQARVTFQRVIRWIEQATNDELVLVPHAISAAVWAAYILDQYSNGASIASRALRLARRHGQADVFANLGTGLSFCQTSLGLLDDAEKTGEQAVHDAERYGSPALISMARAGLMVAALGRNNPSLLKQRFDKLMETPLPEFGWFRRAVLTTRTRVSAMLGRPEPCLELLGSPKDAMAALRYADAAIVAAAQGDSKTAASLIAEGLQIAEEQEQGGQKAMILTTQAELLLRSENPLRAGSLFRTARDIFEQHDMRLQLWRAQAGIARAEAALTEQAEPLARLTTREREVASFIAEGLPNKKVAERLVLSHRTVENHIRNILKKLDIESRQDIIEIVSRNPSAQ